MRKASLKYDKWKSKHNPDYKPWQNPEQIRVPRLDKNDIMTLDASELPKVDESNINETEGDKGDLEDNE